MNSLKIDTGIDWLGEVPQEWTRCRLKTTIKESFNGVWGDEPKDNENDLICIRVADFNYNKLTINLNKYTVRNIPENQHNRMLKKGDILIEKSGGGEKQPVGRAIIYDNEIEEAVCSNFIGKITLYKSKVIPKFVVYYLSSLYSNGINTKHIKQTTGIQNLDLESYLNESIYLPLLTEQQRIADFLDQKCASIDALIEKKRKLIKLKKEERTALINQAVTKGLDPNVTMKDSGIEWLGEIPEHWEVKRLKYVTSKIGDGIHTTPNYIDKSDIHFINGNNLCDGSIIVQSNTRCIDESEYEKHKIDLKFGSILISINGTIGNLAHYSGEKVILGKSAAYIECTDNFRNEFVYYFFQSEYIHNYFENSLSGTTIKNLSLNTLQNTKVLIPSFEEQTMIITSLKEKTLAFDKIIEKLTKQIEIIKEYKINLISEAVSGKLYL